MDAQIIRNGASRLYFLGALFALEAVGLVVLFQVLSDLDCRATGYHMACRALRGVMVHGLCVFTGAIILLALRQDLRGTLVRAAQAQQGSGRTWGWLHGLGLVVILLPRIVTDPTGLNEAFPLIFAGLLVGGVLAGLSGVFWMLRPAAWWQWLATAPVPIASVLVIALLTPTLATIFNPLWWSLEILVVATFFGVAVLLTVTGNPVAMDPEREVIGTGEFLVQVADTCSGIEGLALTTAFMGIYSVLMHGSLRQGRFWLFVWPAALVMSFVFNIFRITGLIAIGAYFSPELAVNGFHSFAGWLAFTVLSLIILVIVQAVPGLMHEDVQTVDRSALPPLREDRSAAFILPFLVFMLSGLVVNTFYSEPAIGYPIQAGAMLAALLWFRKPFLDLEWRLDPVAIGSGVVIGVGWIVTAGASDPISGLAEMGAGVLAFWVIARIVGTSVLVPIVEEAFFRGYVMGLIDDGTPVRRVAAVVVTTAGFALLHGRYLEAGIAGLVFAWVALRKGRVADAIVSHAVANALIACAALAKGDWSLI